MSNSDSEFLQIFKDEANQRLDRVVATLLELERGEGSQEAVEELFRETHTIKGGAGLVGLAEVHDVAHAMEDVLADAREGGAFPDELIEPLLQAADSLRRQVAGEGGDTQAVVDSLTSTRADIPTATEGEQTKASRPTVPGERRSIRVPAEKIDKLLDLVGEAVLNRQRLEHSLEYRLAVKDDEVSDQLTQGDRLVDDLKDAAIGMRTLPLASITGSFPRAVRDLASSAGREVELIITGAETELDRAILEGLAEPLVHLLRNAIAHGIEEPEERLKAGKPRVGRLELRAEQRGGLVEVTVSDDGRGVPEETIAEARVHGSLTEVLTRPGYSTADEVSGLSGRGVGLDAVKAHVQSFGGTLDVQSEVGAGTHVILLLPLALALLDVLLVSRGENVYGIPLGSVEEAITVTDTLSLGGRSAIEVRGESIALSDLAELVGAEAPTLRDRAPAIVFSSGSKRVAAACDALLGEEEVVVKNMGTLLASQAGYLGAAILGDSRIALLLDPTELTRAIQPGAKKKHPPITETEEQSSPKVLVVEDSFTVRELQRSILEAAGYSVDIARNGKEALDVLSSDDTIELVLTDVEMPEMDGITLTESIRSLPERSEVPVVILTTRGEEEDRRRGIDAGADAYMAKHSFDQQALLETVERLIGR